MPPSDVVSCSPLSFKLNNNSEITKPLCGPVSGYRQQHLEYTEYLNEHCADCVYIFHLYVYISIFQFDVLLTCIQAIVFLKKKQAI